MIYFSYGSNMSLRRLQQRTPSAAVIEVAELIGHKLMFHKRGRDGSAKCDAAETGCLEDRVIGVLYEIQDSEKATLDLMEGLGNGYEEKAVVVKIPWGSVIEAQTYYATHIDASLKPYHWYKAHVLQGARENELPAPYVQIIESFASIADPNPERHDLELAIYR